MNYLFIVFSITETSLVLVHYNNQLDYFMVMLHVMVGLFGCYVLRVSVCAELELVVSF